MAHLVESESFLLPTHSNVAEKAGSYVHSELNGMPTSIFCMHDIDSYIDLLFMIVLLFYFTFKWIMKMSNNMILVKSWWLKSNDHYTWIPALGLYSLSKSNAFSQLWETEMLHFGNFRPSKLQKLLFLSNLELQNFLYIFCSKIWFSKT